MAKSWGGIGAWAADAERAEAEEREHQSAVDSHHSNESQSFPSLKEAAAAKPKKKKPAAMSLSEFTTGSHIGPGGGGRRDLLFDSKGLTPEEMLRLPTGPKERSAEEMDFGRLGGGFRSYGRSGGPPPGRRDRGDDSEGSWGGGGARRTYGGFDEERRGQSSRVSDFDQPSRADEVDNWASGKKPIAFADSGRQDRYVSLGGGGGGGGSRADEVDSWASGKKAIPVRSSGFGSGFGSGSGSGSGSGFRDSVLDSDRWSRGGLGDGERERPRLVLDPRRGDVGSNEPAKTRPSLFGTRPREEVLAEKGLDWRKLELENEARKTSRPTSSQSSRPSSAQSSRQPESPPPLAVVEGAGKPRPKVNPFGDAKPREVLLQEKGMDWRKIDLELEHRGVDRPKTEEERMLKEEINHLKELMKEAEVKVNGESVPVTAKECVSLREQILIKETDLDKLIRDLDDKVRFGQKASERPGSGAGRIASFPDRPPSQSGMPEEPRSMEFTERPRSRGSGDVWTRSGDDRRAFQSGRERGFFANRDIDRWDPRLWCSRPFESGSFAAIFESGNCLVCLPIPIDNGLTNHLAVYFVYYGDAIHGSRERW